MPNATATAPDTAPQTARINGALKGGRKPRARVQANAVPTVPAHEADSEPRRVRVGTVSRATLSRADDLTTDLEHSGRQFTVNVKISTHNGRAAGRITGRTSDNGVNDSLTRVYIIKDNVGGAIREASPQEVKSIIDGEVHAAKQNAVNKRVQIALTRLADNEQYAAGKLKKRPARMTDGQVSDIKEYAAAHYPRIKRAYMRDDSLMAL